MRDSSDARLRWLFTRLEAEERCDVSDATMAYFLMTGDEECDPRKLAALLDRKQRPPPIAVRNMVRLEAENFQVLENCVLVAAGRQASQDALVRLSGAQKGTIRTEFDEIHAARSGRYEVGIRCRHEGAGQATIALSVGGVRQGVEWRSAARDEERTSAAGDDAWQSHTVRDVPLSQGDAIEIEVLSEAGGSAEVDCVQLTYRGPGDGAAEPGRKPVDSSRESEPR
jgi:hypothetical protein